MYRILSLDGGGSWAILQVMALQQIYGRDTTGHEVLRHFNLVAANSGGSITLGGLIENKSLRSLVDDFYMQLGEREKIFVRAGFFDDPEAAVLRPLGIGAKYRADAKLQGLRGILASFGNRPLTELSKATGLGDGFPDLVICSFDYDRSRGMLFRSNTASAARNGEAPLDPTLAEAIHASSNAPVLYFDAPARVQGHQFWDGGVAGYNNPVLVAVIEALANGHRADEVRALSIGTGTLFLPFDIDHTENPDLVQRPRQSAPIADLRELASAIVDDPPDIASFHAHVALGGDTSLARHGIPIASPIVRLNPLIQPVGSKGSWKVPDGLSPRDFQQLQQIPMDAIEQDRVELIVRLGEAWIAGSSPNQPIRVNRDTLACEIGYRTFRQGVAAWKG